MNVHLNIENKCRIPLGDLNEILEATYWAVHELELDFFDDSDLVLTLTKFQKNYYGDADGDWATGEYEIRAGGELTLQTIFHELTHIAQMANMDLELYSKKAYWQGKMMKLGKTHEEYENYPWEVEAREVENKLFKRWKKYKRNGTINDIPILDQIRYLQS